MSVALFIKSVESWIDSYFESLAKVYTETGQSKALALKRSNFPTALYRYRSLERLAYKLEELRDGYVFLSDPAKFNDPYDSALSVSWEQVQKQVLEKFGIEYSKFFESLEESQKEEWRIQQEQGFQSPGLLSLFGPSADPFSWFQNLVRVSCFATNPNSVVMWSHYANQHTGICIEFSRSSMLSSAKFLELLHPVRYSEKILDAFQLTWPNMPEEVWHILAACHKSKEWEYENEWRLVSLDPASGGKFFLDPCGIKPSRIILGERIDQPNQAAIEELAQKISVPVIKAELAKDRFKIQF